ncbi:MAG: hypothetical protein L6Q54_11510 [Leptospiraceae bacterium]|nr:hypothetical protein [Leptospiraceae bacterium]
MPFVKTITDDEILKFIEFENIITSRVLANRFGFVRRTARRRIKYFEKKGLLKKLPFEAKYKLTKN